MYCIGLVFSSLNRFLHIQFLHQSLHSSFSNVLSNIISSITFTHSSVCFFIIPFTTRNLYRKVLPVAWPVPVHTKVGTTQAIPKPLKHSVKIPVKFSHPEPIRTFITRKRLGQGFRNPCKSWVSSTCHKYTTFPCRTYKQCSVFTVFI